MLNKMLLRIVLNEGLLFVILLIGLSRIIGIWGMYIFLLMLPLLYAKKRSSNRIDSTQITILIFSITYTLFIITNNLPYGISDVVYFLIYPLLFYNTGKYFGKKYSENYLLTILLVLLITQAGYWLILVLLNIANGEFVNIHRNFVFNDKEFAVTLVGVSFALLASGIVLFWVKAENIFQLKVKRIIIAFGILGLICSIYFLNRSIIAIISICIFFVLLFRIFKGQYNKVITIIISIALFGIAFSFTPQGNTIFNSYKERELSESESSAFMTGGGRIARWKDSIESIIDEPFGGGKSEWVYAHNLWLDVGKRGGIIPLFFLFLATIITTAQMIRVYLAKRYSYLFKIYLSIIFITFIVTCSIEPIIQGAFNHFLLMLLFWGILSALDKNKSVKISSNLK